MPESTAREVADVVLLSLFSQGATTAQIDAKREQPGAVIVERDQQIIARALIDVPIAQAVVVRFALLADLDPFLSESQLGRCTVRVDEMSYEVLVSTRRTADAATCEVRLLDARGERDTRELGVGSRVGPYKIIESLGSGGMGAVYLVEHKQLQKRFAMKVLLRDVFDGDPGAGARFVCEARAAARGQHPGIINVSDFGSLADGRAFLIMELLSGESVAEIIRRGPIAPDRALRLMGGVADALGAAHDAGVVHRDLTPSNMFVEIDKLGRERPVLVDFGAAKMTGVDLPGEDDDGHTKVVFGTPYYMAPEHAQGRPTDARSDIYALGCCLFEMLTGDVPYKGGSVREILLGHILDPLPRLTGAAAELPALDKLLQRMLAKRPSKRYQSTAELSAGIASCLERLEKPDATETV